LADRPVDRVRLPGGGRHTVEKKRQHRSSVRSSGRRRNCW
jgi:hypothetical protein